MKGSRGFTLLELLAALAIGSVLLAFAVPAFKDYLASARTSSTTNLMVAYLNTARTEAVTRSEPVAMCVSTDQETCNASQSWESGWIVFTDSDGLPGVRDGADVLLHAAQVSGDGMSLGSGSSYVRFDSMGAATAD